MGRTRHHRHRLAAGLVTLAVVAGACSTKESGGSLPSAAPASSTAPATTGSTADAGTPTSAPGAETTAATDVERTASDVGVTADTISVAYVYPDLRQFVKDGLIDDSLPYTEHLQPLVDEVNASGGINGRTLQLRDVTWDATAFPASLVTACTQIAEDAPNLLAFSPSFFGDGAACLAGDHGVPLMTMSGMAGTVYDPIQQNTFLFNLTFEEAQRGLVGVLAKQGSLDGLKLGAVARDEPGGPQAIEAALRPALKASGFDLAEVVVIAGTGDEASYSAAIQRLKGAGVTGVFITTNLNIAGPLITEADRQGYHPQWMGSDQSEFTTSAVAKNIPPGVLEGALGTTYRRSPGTPPTAQDQACLDARATIEPPLGEPGSTVYGAYLQVCAIFEVMVEALRAAGPNPTRASVVSALENLGPFDMGTGGTGQFRPGHHIAPSEVRPVTFHQACECWEPTGPFVPIG